MENRVPTRAETLSQELIAEMQKDPTNHSFWVNANSAIDRYHLAIPGQHGGSFQLAMNTLKSLGNIHFPVCSGSHQ